MTVNLMVKDCKNAITMFFLVFSDQFCTLGLYVTSNVVKLMFIALFQFHVCYHDGV